uniref:SAM-dependent methyltransferase n=1 Tax=Pararhizobium sp. IMCC3301 TaxID=3067904 RepID=UPI0027424057|nr:cyclopropane-fatty-acyl-phospholipid synthase family protein [Pararhizobium sp. IMCC3301]
MDTSQSTRLRQALHIIAAEIASHLDVPLSLKLWDGTYLPLGIAAVHEPANKLAIIIADPGAIPALLRRPGLDRIIRLYARGVIDFEGGTLIDIGNLLTDKSTRKRLKAISKRKLLKTLLPLVTLPGVDVSASRRFKTDATGGNRKTPDKRETIGFHYDVSNAFYELFLDEAMVYTCAYFTDWSHELAKAQFDKLDMSCRKLRLKPGERLLDIGCGWGALICHAAKHYGVHAHGVTLSQEQYDYAVRRIASEGLGDLVSVELIDYQDVKGKFDKISSIGMYEHIGIAALPDYMSKVRSLLKPEGLFLNHGITRRAKRKATRFADRPEQRALVRYIFPGGELDDIGHTLQELERAGFEVHDVEGWREHYALTTKMWCERLTAKRDEAVAIVGEETYRIWVAYLAGCSLAFTRGSARIYQTLSGHNAKGASSAPPSRADLYQ